jgi:predicted MFS family arabinose efflux permease
MAVAVAPVFGPVFGGYLAEIHSWRWSFYMLVPIGICATIGMSWTLPSESRTEKVASTGPASSRLPPPLPPCSSCSRAACGWTGSIRPRS